MGRGVLGSWGGVRVVGGRVMGSGVLGWWGGRVMGDGVLGLLVVG